MREYTGEGDGRGEGGRQAHQKVDKFLVSKNII